MLAPALSFDVTPRRIEGVVHSPSPPPWLVKERKISETHQRGLRYERRILSQLGGEGFHCSQWFTYLDHGDPVRKWAQPDAYAVDKVRLRIVECKIRWTADAITQLLGLYAPLLSWYYKGRSPSLYVVCRSFDPSVPGGDKTIRVESFDEEVKPGVIGIVIRK